MRLNRRGRLALGVALPLVSLLACIVPASQLGAFLTSIDRLSQADAIVVLGGGNGSRAYHAVDLYNQGYAPWVVFSGGTRRGHSLAQQTRAFAQGLGLPTSAALVADPARNTYQEAANLRRLAEREGWHSLIVVTDTLHTRRAARTFRAMLPGVTIYLSAAQDPGYDAAHWWDNKFGRRMVALEVIKLGFYWVHYGVRPV
jgi:uncharacterized SAM-binding protein YcdF (DUF218 family)